MRNMIKPSPQRQTSAALAILAAASLTLTGCGPSSEDFAAEQRAAAQDPQQAAAANEELLTAIATAVGQVGNDAFVYELDRDIDGSFAMDIATTASSRDVVVAPGGTQVRESILDDEMDEADVVAVAEATITVTEAIDAALAEQPGIVQAADLNRENDDPKNPLRWGVGIETGSEYTWIFVSPDDGSIVGRW